MRYVILVFVLALIVLCAYCFVGGLYLDKDYRFRGERKALNGGEFYPLMQDKPWGNPHTENNLGAPFELYVFRCFFEQHAGEFTVDSLSLRSATDGEVVWSDQEERSDTFSEYAAGEPRKWCAAVHVYGLDIPYQDYVLSVVMLDGDAARRTIELKLTTDYREQWRNRFAAFFSV